MTVPDELVADFNRVSDCTNFPWMEMQTRAYTRGVEDGKAEYEVIVAAARDVLSAWNTSEWAQGVQGGGLFEAIVTLRQATVAASQKARE